MQKPACSAARSLLSLCAPIALWCAPSSAQPNAVRVLYSREMPRAVRARMPSGWKSRFFGVCKLPGREGEVLFHLSSKSEVLERDIDDSGKVMGKTLLCSLDVFSRRKRGRKFIVQPLNAVRFEYEDRYDFNTIRADVMWADPQTQRVPILKLVARNLEGYGSFGQDVLVNFPRELSQEANVQQFRSHGSTIEIYRNKFDRMDERGFAVVVQEWSDTTGMSATETEWRWDGEGFTSSPPKQTRP